MGAFRNYDPPTAALFLPLVVRDTRGLAGTSDRPAPLTPGRSGGAGAPTRPAMMELPSDDANRLERRLSSRFSGSASKAKKPIKQGYAPVAQVDRAWDF